MTRLTLNSVYTLFVIAYLISQAPTSVAQEPDSTVAEPTPSFELLWEFDTGG